MNYFLGFQASLNVAIILLQIVGLFIAGKPTDLILVLSRLSLIFMAIAAIGHLCTIYLLRDY